MSFIDKAIKYGKWVLAGIASIFAVIEFLDYFGVGHFNRIGWRGLIIVILVAVSAGIFKIIIDYHNRPNDAQNRIDEINEKINNRIGIMKSSEKPSKKIIDSVHAITSFKRFDVLDYAMKDYISYRVINGKNESNTDSHFLKYKESTDSKTSAEELIVEAYDLKTGKALKVIFEIQNQGQKVYVHEFKIMFTIPLKPNEEFSVIYFIKIPNELDQLSDNEEMMSISLNRYEKKIESLEFGIYLSFEPSQVEVFMRNKNEQAKRIPEEALINITNEIQSDQSIKNYIEKFKSHLGNINICSCIMLKVQNPKKETYVIYYRK